MAKTEWIDLICSKSEKNSLDNLPFDIVGWGSLSLRGRTKLANGMEVWDERRSALTSQNMIVRYVEDRRYLW
jgi:hypothetical protein